MAQLVKNPPAMWETWVGKIPWRRERLPTPVFWPGEFHTLYSSWGHKELDMTEQLSLSLMQETWVRSLSREEPLEKGMATHSSILAWRIPWTEEKLAGCSPWGRKESDTTEQLTLSLSQ